MATRTCIVCRIAFSRRYLRDQQTCSKRCGSAFGHHRKGECIVNRVCLICNKSFIASTSEIQKGWAKYCSKRCKAIGLTIPIEDRFWDKVKKTDGCWEWIGNISPGGYGWVSVNGNGHLAHRIGFTLQTGPIPSGMMVCHHCDNRRCVRGSHLFLGTSKDNMLDASRKGRLKRSYLMEGVAFNG